MFLIEIAGQLSNCLLSKLQRDPQFINDRTVFLGKLIVNENRNFAVQVQKLMNKRTNETMLSVLSCNCAKHVSEYLFNCR